jgi:hypothetical protein
MHRVGCRSVDVDSGFVVGDDSSSGATGELAACLSGAADDGGDLFEGHREHFVEDVDGSFCGGQRFEHDHQRHSDAVIKGDPIGGVGFSSGQFNEGFG